MDPDHTAGQPAPFTAFTERKTPKPRSWDDAARRDLAEAGTIEKLRSRRGRWRTAIYRDLDRGAIDMRELHRRIGVLHRATAARLHQLHDAREA